MEGGRGADSTLNRWIGSYMLCLCSDSYMNHISAVVYKYQRFCPDEHLKKTLNGLIVSLKLLAASVRVLTCLAFLQKFTFCSQQAFSPLPCLHYHFSVKVLGLITACAARLKRVR